MSYLYRPSNVNESILCDLLNVLSEEFISNNNLYVAYGDRNYNWFKHMQCSFWPVPLSLNVTILL